MGNYYPTDYYSYSPQEQGGEQSQAPTKLATNKYARLKGVLSTARSIFAGLRRPLKYIANRYFPPIADDVREGMIPFGTGAILDVGCGAGAFLDVAKSRGWTTFGVELSSDAARIATQKGHLVSGDDIEAMDLGIKEFDVIRMWHSLEHLHDPIATLQRLRTLLKPGGHILIGVPNEAGLLARWFNRYWMGWDIPRHTVAFNPRTIQLALQKSGYVDIRITPYSEPFCMSLSYEWEISGTKGHPRKLSSFADAMWDYLIHYVDRFHCGDLMTVTARPGNAD